MQFYDTFHLFARREGRFNEPHLVMCDERPYDLQLFANKSILLEHNILLTALLIEYMILKGALKKI